MRSSAHEISPPLRNGRSPARSRRRERLLLGHDVVQTGQGLTSTKRHYLHPTRDLGRVTADCDSDKEPYLTLWIINHSDHDMAYDIKYDFVDAHGKTIGTAAGVFTVETHGISGDTRLFDTVGRCSTKARLAYVNAYDDSKDGADQPTF